MPFYYPRNRRHPGLRCNVVSGTSVEEPLGAPYTSRRNRNKRQPSHRVGGKRVFSSSYLNAPLFFQGMFLGFIQIQSGRREFTQQDVHMMERILHYISPIQYSWYQNKLQKKKLGEYIKKLKKSEAKYRSLFTLSPI